MGCGAQQRPGDRLWGCLVPKTIRPWVTSGIAVVGAGVIAVAPFEPLPPGDSIQITNSAVELTRKPAPFDYYPQVVMRSLENAGDRLSEYLAAPLPIVTAVIENQYAAIADIADAAENDDVVAVVDAVIRALAVPVVNLVKVAGSGEPFHMVASLIVRLALPIVSGVMAAASSVGDVVESLLDLDVVGAFSAATNLPARIIDGLLNGHVDATGDEYFGLLAPVTEAPVADQLTGPVSFLIESLQGIGDTISAPSPIGIGEDPATVPVLGAATVPLPVAPPAEAPPPPAAPTPEPPPQSDNTDDPPAGPTEAQEPSEPGGPRSADPAPSPSEEDTEPDPADPDNAPRVDSEESAPPQEAAMSPDDADPGELSESADDDGHESSTGATSADQ